MINKSFININIYYSDEDLTEFLRVIKHAVSFIFNITNHKVLNHNKLLFISKKNNGF